MREKMSLCFEGREESVNSTAPPFSRDSGDPKLKVTDFIANHRF
ncbi:unnamed protein product [Brassica napus]|uniref:(rape) hypothetical protein n=1 Tax=Brassica napus TaxID=3708 RepID=A0A816XM55_BRANA|nr:unnamed protein product [Brassica napus]